MDLPLDELKALVVQEALQHGGRGREAQPDDRRARGRAPARRGQGAHALQRRLARHGVLRDRARRDLHRARAGQDRARLGRRDAPGQPGRPADHLGARPGRRALRADRRQHGRVRDEQGVGRRDHRRRGPDRCQRRHRQQDRNVRAGRAGQASRDPVLRGCADLDDRPHHQLGRGHRHRGTRSARDDGLHRLRHLRAGLLGCQQGVRRAHQRRQLRHAAHQGPQDGHRAQGRRLQLRRLVPHHPAQRAGLQPGLRRHARRADHGHHHRARADPPGAELRDHARPDVHDVGRDARAHDRGLRRRDGRSRRRTSARTSP